MTATLSASQASVRRRLSRAAVLLPVPGAFSGIATLLTGTLHVLDAAAAEFGMRGMRADIFAEMPAAYALAVCGFAHPHAQAVEVGAVAPGVVQVLDLRSRGDQHEPQFVAQPVEYA